MERTMKRKSPKKGKSPSTSIKIVRWTSPRLILPKQTRFCLTKGEFHKEYGLSLVGQDPKLIVDEEISDAEWTTVWMHKRYSHERYHLKGLRPELYEECLLLHHKVYQGPPSNNELTVHFARGFTWERCKIGSETEENVIAWAVFAEGVVRTIRQQNKLDRKMEKWRLTNGPCSASWDRQAPAENTGFTHNDFCGDGDFSVGGKKHTSTTLSASSADVAAIKKMRTFAAEQLKQKRQRLEDVKIALEEYKTKRDEKVGLMRGVSKVVEKLRADMEELNQHKSRLVPNEAAIARLEVFIEARKEALKDMGFNNIEYLKDDDLDTKVAEQQAQCGKLLGEVEVAAGHVAFVETITAVFKSRMPIIPVRPPVQSKSVLDSWIHLDKCVACGITIMQTVVSSVYMLQCQHTYHPLCFATACASVSKCLSPGCEESLAEAVNVVTQGDTEMDEHAGTEADKHPMEATFGGSPFDGIAHSQAGSSHKPDFESTCGGNKPGHNGREPVDSQADAPSSPLVQTEVPAGPQPSSSKEEEAFKRASVTKGGNARAHVEEIVVDILGGTTASKKRKFQDVQECKTPKKTSEGCR